MALTKVSRGLLTTSIVDNGNATAITIDSSENVGIGTSVDLFKFTIGSPVGSLPTYSNPSSGHDQAWMRSTNTGAGSNYLMVLDIGIHGATDATNGGSDIRFITQPKVSPFAPLERMRIDSSGNLLVGATSGSLHILSKSKASGAVLEIINSSGTAPSNTSFKFTGAAPNNGSSTFFTTADTSAYRGGWLSNGGVQNYQANNSNLSDRREKTNFVPAKSYLDIICDIPVQTFNYIDQNMEDDDSPSLGVVAQDVQAVAPELVVESNWGTKDDPKMRLAIYQTDFQYALMKSIQELKEELNTATARITALENN